MRKFNAYADNVKKTIQAYAEAAGSYAQDSAGRIQRTYEKKRHRLERKVRWLHIKNTVERVINVTLMAALLISIVCMVTELLKNQND